MGDQKSFDQEQMMNKNQLYLYYAKLRTDRITHFHYSLSISKRTRKSIVKMIEKSGCNLDFWTTQNELQNSGFFDNLKN